MAVPSIPTTDSGLLPARFGFRTGTTSVHTSRTMMLEELAVLFGRVPQSGRVEAYAAAIVEDNLLGKSTRSTRQRTYLRLVELYALEPKSAIFRILRQVWAGDVQARPVAAYLAAMARDPLLRAMTPFVCDRSVGVRVSVEEITKHLQQLYPTRFGNSTATATAQRLASSWGQVGYLKGKVQKVRSPLVVSPAAAAVAFALGYLTGRKGQMLFDTPWAVALDRRPEELVALAEESSRQGWMTYRAAGAVVDITFPTLIAPAEEKDIHEPN